MVSRIAYNNPRPDGSFGLPYHYEMLSDARRVQPFAAAIQATCAGKVVLDGGAGAGIMSLLAARAGASKVYAIEKDATIARIAAANIERSGYGNVKLIVNDILELTADDIDGYLPDVVISENLSTWQITEPQIAILNHINARLSHAETIRIPAVVENFVQLCEAQYVFESLVELTTHYFEFSGVREAVSLSAPELFTEIDFSRSNSAYFRRALLIEATGAGMVNSLRLTSFLRVYRDITLSGLDSLLPPVVVPLPRALAVRAGDVLQVIIRYQVPQRWDQFECDLAPAR